MRITYLIILLLTLFFARDTQAKPNVIFIICDDLNDSVEGFGGHPQASTPNIDRLAHWGVRFVNAQCNAPICGPSRASLWSGFYPHTTGYFGFNQQANRWRNNAAMKDCVTLFEHMNEGGYKVFATGKLHHNGHEDWNAFKDDQGISGFKVQANFGPYPSGKNPTNAKRGNLHPDMPNGMRGMTWDYGFGPIRTISDAFEGTGYWKYTHSDESRYEYRSPQDRDRMPDERCADYAIELLQQQHNSPFMIAIGFNRPHSPLYVPENYFERFPFDEIQLSATLQDDIEDCATAFRTQHDVGTSRYAHEKYTDLQSNGGLDQLKKWTQAYLACVSFVDDQVGRVMKALEESVYADDTIIVFTSDHGYHMGEKQRLFKNTVWERATRVPLVISGPGVSSDSVCTAPVSLIDLYPTLIDFCGLDSDPNANTNGIALDGASLRGLLEKPGENKWAGPAFAVTAIASSAPLEINQPGKPRDQHYSIRSERYRYILCRNGEEELYDHLVDPHEWYNLAEMEQYSALKAQFRKQIDIVLNDAD